MAPFSRDAFSTLSNVYGGACLRIYLNVFLAVKYFRKKLHHTV